MKTVLAVVVGIGLGFIIGYLAFSDDPDDGSGPSITKAEAEELVRNATDADEAHCRETGEEFSCRELYIQFDGGSMHSGGQSRVVERGGEWVVE